MALNKAVARAASDPDRVKRRLVDLGSWNAISTPGALLPRSLVDTILPRES
jgi:hypothetical protein